LRAQRRSPPREQPTSETVTQERVAALRFDGRLLSRQINLALGDLALRLPQCLTSAQTLIKKSKLVLLANEIPPTMLR
jgi:hypothetical protein